MNIITAYCNQWITRFFSFIICLFIRGREGGREGGREEGREGGREGGRERMKLT